MAFIRYGIQGIGEPPILLIRPMKFEFKGDSCNEHKHDFGHAVPVMIGGLHVIESKLADPDDIKSIYTINEYDIDAPQEQDAHAQSFFKSNFIVINADSLHKLIARYDNTIAGCLYPPRKAKPPHDIEGVFTGWIACCG